MAITNIQQLEFDEIKEEIFSQESNKRLRTDEKDSVCDVCLVAKNSKVISFYICYSCGYFLCEVCFNGHELHHNISVLGDKSDRMTKRLELLGIMRDVGPMVVNFDKEDISVYDRVMVRHRLDTSDCYITGICGLGGREWAVCDLRNTCIKVLELPNNKIIRYIRLGSQPRDITHVKIEHSNVKAEEVLADISDSDFIFSIAVTLPRIRKILLIDITQSPAKCKSIETQMFCYGIIFHDNKFYTTCDLYPGFRNSKWHVCVLSLHGETLKSIDIYTRLMPNLAVEKDMVYLTDFKHKIQCVNVTLEERVCEIRIDGSEPSGICVDSNDEIYICARNHNKIYKLSSDLTRHESLPSERLCLINRPQSLTCFKEKLFIGHEWPSPLANYVAIVRII